MVPFQWFWMSIQLLVICSWCYWWGGWYTGYSNECIAIKSWTSAKLIRHKWWIQGTLFGRRATWVLLQILLVPHCSQSILAWYAPRCTVCQLIRQFVFIIRLTAFLLSPIELPPVHQGPNDEHDTTKGEETEKSYEDDNSCWEFLPSTLRGAVSVNWAIRKGLIKNANGVEFVESHCGICQAHQAKARLHEDIDFGIADRWKRTIAGGYGISHNGIDVAHKWDTKDHISDIRCGVCELRVCSLDHSNTEICIIILRRFSSEIERVNGERRSIIEGDGQVEGGMARNIIYGKLSTLCNISAMKDSQFPSWAGCTPIAPYIAFATCVVVKI